MQPRRSGGAKPHCWETRKVLPHLMPMLHLGAMAFAVALAFSGFMIAAGVGDIPNTRSNHSASTPTSGGIGLVAALGIMCLGAAKFYPQFGLGPELPYLCLLYTSPSPRDRQKSRMPSSA